MKWFSLLSLITLPAFGFTLNNNFIATFAGNEVNVTIAGNTTCSGIGMTVYELEELISPSVNNFWNRVPTSRLRLRAVGFSANINNIDNGALCSPTDDDCINNADGPLIPPVEGIVIGCNRNNKNFGSSNVLAVTVPNHFTGTKIKGAAILINDSGLFGTLSRADKISVIAHEIGHAIGLGHAEEHNRESLMYYRVVNLRRSLGQDDIDGVSYLYPIKFDGCGLVGATISENKNELPPPGPMILPMLLGFVLINFLVLIRRLLSRFEARTTL
jgi:hypothetical protein